MTNNPRTYDNVNTNRSNSQKAQCHQETKYTQQAKEEKYSQQSRKVVSEDSRQKTINTPEDKRTVQQNGKVIKTGSGQIVKKPDRLSYT